MSIKMSLDPQLTKQVISILGEVVDEFRLQISNDGWKIAAVDPANVALIHIDMPKDNFKSYQFEETDNYTSCIDSHPTGVQGEVLKVGIEVDKIKQFFGKAFFDNFISEPYMPEERTTPVEFIFSKAPEKYNGRYQLELKQGMFSRKMLLLPEREIRKDPKIPGLGLDYELYLNTLEFRRMVIKAAEINDYITLGYKREGDTFIFTASAVDDNDFPFEATKPIYNFTALKDNARNSATSLFSLDYLTEIVKKMPLSMFRLQIGQDHPCKLLFVLDKVAVVYLQAPRVESE